MKKSRLADIKYLQLSDALSAIALDMMLNLHTPSYMHCKDVAIMARRFGEFLCLSSEELELLVLGAFLHDIGKYFVPFNILNKTEALTYREWQIMKLHPQVENVMLGLSEKSALALPLIHNHHERLDGSGYPNNLLDADIPYLARIVQLIDIYDALTHTRSYKQRFTHEQAIAIILEETKKGWYDQSLVEKFLMFLVLS